MTNDALLSAVLARYEAQRAIDTRRAGEVALWMHEVSGPEWRWYVKILRGNDTLLTGAHQAGPYISWRILFELFPTVAVRPGEKATLPLPTRIDSHGDQRVINAKWYPSKNEAHLTGWGGSKSPILDPEATGSIVVLAFHQPPGGDADECRVWLCASVAEEEEVQERVGPVEPGTLILYEPGGAGARTTAAVKDSPCALRDDELPPGWRFEFPTAAEIVAAAVGRLPTARTQKPDDRLLRRRECEYELFRSVEQCVILPRIREAFATVDLFVEYANSVTNRRKSRSGASLGLQTSTVFTEEGLSHSYDKVSEGNKRPDFLFPSAQAYQVATSSDGIAMLAAKTTCKDRWRQILNEADKLPIKHLLTLQEGISLNQFDEMEREGVVLVVPSRLHSAFHPTIVPKLLSLTEFITRTKAHCNVS